MKDLKPHSLPVFCLYWALSLAESYVSQIKQSMEMLVFAILTVQLKYTSCLLKHTYSCFFGEIPVCFCFDTLKQLLVKFLFLHICNVFTNCIIVHNTRNKIDLHFYILFL